MDSRIRLFICLAMLALIVSPSLLFADTVPSSLTYQGKLTDSQGTPITGNVSMAFSIWDDPAAGTRLWVEPPSGEFMVPVANGIFSVLLGGNGVPLTPGVFSGGTTRFLEIQVGGQILAPRQPISAVGYAAQAERSANTDRLGNLPPSSWQVRVTGTCPPGTAIATINADGTVICSSGTTGQAATTVYGGFNGTLDSTFRLVTGLTQTITVPANCVVVIMSDGNARSNGGPGNVTLALFIDGVMTSSGGVRCVTTPTDNQGNGSYASWSLSLTQTLSPGSHTIEVRARTWEPNPPTIVGSANGLSNAAQLTTLILKL